MNKAVLDLFGYEDYEDLILQCRNEDELRLLNEGYMIDVYDKRVSLEEGKALFFLTKNLIDVLKERK